MDTARLGIVGLGWFGGVLTDAARASGVAEVVSLLRAVAGHASGVRRATRLSRAGDLDELLADPRSTG